MKGCRVEGFAAFSFSKDARPNFLQNIDDGDRLRRLKIKQINWFVRELEIWRVEGHFSSPEQSTSECTFLLLLIKLSLSKYQF